MCKVYIYISEISSYDDDHQDHVVRILYIVCFTFSLSLSPNKIISQLLRLSYIKHFKCDDDDDDDADGDDDLRNNMNFLTIIIIKYILNDLIIVYVSVLVKCLVYISSHMSVYNVHLVKYILLAACVMSLSKSWLAGISKTTTTTTTTAKTINKKN